MLGNLLGDVRLAIRNLRRARGFTILALTSLALGIGATVAVFGAISNVLLDPLPVDRPEELAVLYWDRDAEITINQINSSGYVDPRTGTNYSSNYSYPLYQALREAAPEAQLFAFTFLRNVSLAVGTEPPIVAGGLLADGHYFASLRPPIALGRGLLPSDDQPDAPLVAVISHGIWQRMFRGARDALGRTVRVNGVTATVVGVTGVEFDGMSRGGFFPRTDVTLPLAAQPLVAAAWSGEQSLFTAQNVFWLRVMGRGRIGDDALGQRLAAAFRSVASPANEGAGPPAHLLLAPGARGPQPVAAETAKLLWILLSAVAVVLLIVCFNLANLMLARGAARERDVAIRRALGGGRGAIVQQTVVEGLVLSVMGAALGIALVFVGREAISRFFTSGLGGGSFTAIIVRPELDLHVLAVALGACVVTTLVFSLAPALRMAAVDPAGFLQHRGTGGAPRLTVGRVLVALQIAISIPLVVGAALLLQTVANLNRVELGFDPQGLAIFQLNPGYTRLPEEQYPDLYRAALERVRALPGVESATLIENALMSGITSNTTATVGDREHQVYMNAVGPNFIETMGMRLVAGRMPLAHEGAGSARVAALNETAARLLFGTESPVGRTIRMRDRDVLIVGVVNDSRYEGQRANVRPIVFDAALQRAGWGGHHVVVRSRLPLARLEPEIRTAIATLDPNLPVPDLRSQVQQLERRIARERVFTQLIAAFGGFALLLASIGLHGVTAYAVARRTGEIGVRMAFGARSGQVLGMVLRQVAALAAVGALIGVPVALALGPVLASLLYGVAPREPAVVAGAVALMVIVAITAGMLPARRAAALDPMVALRRE